MTEQPDFKTLRTQAPAVDAPAAGPRRDNPPILGWFAVGFGLIGVFVFAPLFVPLSLILGIIALFLGQIGLGLLAILLAVIGLATSPTLLVMLGLSALGAYFGF